MNIKRCIDCRRFLGENSFHWRNRKKQWRHSCCKRCDKNRLYLWRLDNQEKNYDKEYTRGWIEILTLLELVVCEKCGYDKCFAAIEYHHRDPKTKKHRVSRLIDGSPSLPNVLKALKEIEKCAVLCANCHREEHAP